MQKKIVSIIVLIILLVSCLNIPINYANSNNEMSVEYCSHVQDVGWEEDFSKSNGETSGTSGCSLRLEAMKIRLNNAPEGVNIKYRTHVQNIGWQNWVSNGEMAGTSGQSLRLEAIQIMLEGTSDYKLQYRVHVQDIGWQEWKESGVVAGTEGRSLRLEAIEIKIVPLNEKVEYSSHIQNVGWESDFSHSNGETSGTTGKSQRVEALKIRLSGFTSDARIEYQTHVQDIGWQNWVSNGQVAGTTGQSLRVEAIKIRLKNVDNKSIQYRVHVQDIGWQDWKEDGTLAGTTGRSLRIEAIEIRIVDKTAVKKGIDVSTFQNDIDWRKVKEDGVDFAMIRAGFRGYGVSSDGISGKLVTDDYFRRNVEGAIANGIEVGVYFFTQAINVQEAIDEANYTLNLVRNYNITYPIAIDTEPSSHPSGGGRADSLSVQERTDVVKAFCDTIRNAGYEPMIYASKYWFYNQLDITQLSNNAIWLAHYTGATQDDPFAKPSNYEGKYIMWQYTASGTVNGILGKVDMNVTTPDKAQGGVGLNALRNSTQVVGSEIDENTQIKVFF